MAEVSEPMQDRPTQHCDDDITQALLEQYVVLVGHSVNDDWATNESAILGATAESTVTVMFD